MELDFEAYIRYYNQDSLHTANGNLSPISFEVSKEKVFYLTWAEHLGLEKLHTTSLLLGKSFLLVNRYPGAMYSAFTQHDVTPVLTMESAYGKIKN